MFGLLKLNLRNLGLKSIKNWVFVQLKVNPHRASAAMLALPLALPLPLKYIVTLGNARVGGSIPKHHNVFNGDAAAAADSDARCV